MPPADTRTPTHGVPASIRQREDVNRVAARGGVDLGAERGRDDSEDAEAGRDGDALLAVHRVGDRVAVRRVAEAALPQDSRPTPASAAAGQCLPYRRCLRPDPRAGRSSSCRPGRAGRRPRHLFRPRVQRQRRVRIERVVRRRHPAAGRWSTCARARRRCPGRAGLRRRRPEADRRQHRRVPVAGTPNQRGDLPIGFRAELSLPAGRHLGFSITAAPPIAAPPSGCWSSHSCPRGRPTRRSGSPCCRAASSESRASTAG